MYNGQTCVQKKEWSSTGEIESRRDCGSLMEIYVKGFGCGGGERVGLGGSSRFLYRAAETWI